MPFSVNGGVDPAIWLPASLALRLGSIALALALARRTAASRWAALGGSCPRLAPDRRPWPCRSSRAAAPPAEACSRTPRPASPSATGSIGSRPGSSSCWRSLAVPIAVYSLGYLGHGALDRRSPFVAIGFSVLVGAVEMVFAADGVVGFLFAWELMTLANAALVATEHEEPKTRRAAFLYLAMSHVATGCLFAGFLILSAAAGSMSFAHAARRQPRSPADAVTPCSCSSSPASAVKAGVDPAARVAAGGAPGGAQQHLRAHVRGDDQDRGLRPLPRVRLRPRTARAELGRPRPRLRRRLRRPGRAVRADAARPQAPARLPQHREHRDHPARARARG